MIVPATVTDADLIISECASTNWSVANVPAPFQSGIRKEPEVGGLDPAVVVAGRDPGFRESHTGEFTIAWVLDWRYLGRAKSPRRPQGLARIRSQRGASQQPVPQ